MKMTTSVMVSKILTMLEESGQVASDLRLEAGFLKYFRFFCQQPLTNHEFDLIWQ